MEAPTEQSRRRPTEWAACTMVIVTVGCLLAAGWLRYSRSKTIEPPTVGAPIPPLELLDLHTSEPLFLLGLSGRVVWIVFWSADSPSGRATLAEIGRVWPRLRSHRRFTLVAAAMNADHPERVRAAAAAGSELPIYLATPETRRRFGIEHADPPLHLLIGADGRVTAIARGEGPQTIERIADQAKLELDRLDPAGDTRFASAGMVSSPETRDN
jgi:hypothetical protein